MAIVRWMAFNHHPVPFAATAFASVLFSSSGVLNVILYSVTRPKLIPNRDTTVLMYSSSSDWQKQTLSRRPESPQVGYWEELPRVRLETPGISQVIDITPPRPPARHFRPPPTSFLDPLDEI